MSNLGSAINTALRSLEANQIALAVASNNIANANTPGYTRERVMMHPVGADSGRFSVGAGVEVKGIEAIRDRLIEVRLRQETSSRSESNSMHESLSDIEMLFTESDTVGLLPQLAAFFNGFHALSADPASPNLREQVLTNARRMSDFFHSRDSDLSSRQAAINESIGRDVDKINSLAGQIAALTTRINEQEVLQSAHDVRDQRQALVKELSGIVGVKELDSNGTYQLTIGGNRPLVFNDRAIPISATASGPGGFLAVQSGQDDITAEISGGELAARITMRDELIPKYRQQLDQLAYEIAARVNTVHQGGYDLDGNTAINFFAPLASASGAAHDIALSTDVTASARRVAVSRQSSGSDNEVAMELGNLLHAPVFSGGSVTDQYRGFIFSIASDAAGAELSTKQHDALALQLENRRQSVSGVSIDEETTQILQFQRAYEASARVVRVIDEMLQVALSMGAS